MKAAILVKGILITCLLSTANIVVAEKVKILETIPFSEVASVPEAVRNQCKLGERTSVYLDKYSKNIERVETLGEGRYLDLEITDVFAPGGGAWSGPKWVEVYGTLIEGEKEIATFRAKRFSTGGVFGGFMGTCKILNRCSKALGRDISYWLKNPVDHAELGDAL